MATEDGLKRAAPEATGVDAQAIRAFLDDAAAAPVELHSFMLYRAGAVIAEASWWPYRTDAPHMLHSATKSFLAVAVGLAIDEGFFGLGSKVVDLFPARVPADASPHLAAMTVEDLLTQTSGHDHGVSGAEWRSIRSGWMAEFLALPVVHEPGTRFVYTSATSFMLSAVVSHTTGQTVRDFLEPRLFRPLGIKLLAWDVSPPPETICPGGNGISCRPSDFLKLGILHLQKGKWNGRQILPEAWAVSSTTSQRGNLHGYHWWTNEAGHYWASGMFGQFAIVFPEHDAVLVTTGAVPQGAQRLSQVIWHHFPRMFETTAEPAGGAGEALSRYLATLRLLPPLEPMHKAPPVMAQINRERFAVKDNEDGVFSFALDFAADHCVFHLQDRRGFHQVRVGLQDWHQGETTLSGAKLHHGYEPARLRATAGGRWTCEDTFQMTMQFNETAFRDQVTVRFSTNNGSTFASLDRSVNVNSFGTQRPTLFGAVLVSGNELSSAEFLAMAEATVKYSTSTSTVGQLLDNPQTRQVLLEEAPDLFESPRLDKAREYTLDLIIRHAGLDASDLERINGRLQEL